MSNLSRFNDSSFRTTGEHGARRPCRRGTGQRLRGFRAAQSRSAARHQPHVRLVLPLVTSLSGQSPDAAAQTGLGILLFGVFVRTVLVWHITWAVNSVTHLWGYRSYETDEDSRNNFVVGLRGVGANNVDVQRMQSPTELGPRARRHAGRAHTADRHCGHGAQAVDRALALRRDGGNTGWRRDPGGDNSRSIDRQELPPAAFAGGDTGSATVFFFGGTRRRVSGGSRLAGATPRA